MGLEHSFGSPYRVGAFCPTELNWRLRRKR